MVVTTNETKTLRQLLADAVSPYVATAWDERIDNPCIDDISERFDESPEALQDFCRSDWVNLAEPYTYQLLQRWNQQEDGIRALWNEYCGMVGATSTMECLEGELTSFEDGDDVNIAIVNHAMTWAALELCSVAFPEL